jgi:hypothetical protein
VAYPVGRPSKTNLHEVVLNNTEQPTCPDQLARKRLNPRAANIACANKPDNMEPYGRIPMLTLASHGTGAPAI